MIGDRWNVTDDEVARHYPCDDLVHAPTLQAWRGVSVHATPEALWPWIELTGEIMGTCISYVLVPQGQITRLLMKIVTRVSRRLAPRLSLGDLIMARRQLLNLKRLAEQHRPVAH